MKREMLINVMQPEEVRIAIVEDGVLEELYVERTSHESYVGNIYKGRIVNIEPSIQAAFVDFGVGRNGFLHVSDVEPAYYRHLETGRGEPTGRDRGRGRDRDRGERGGRDRGGRDRDRDRDRGGRGRGRRTERRPYEEPDDARPAELERDWDRPGAIPADPIDPSETAWPEPPRAETPPPDDRTDEDRPRYMDSAERRTDEDDEPARITDDDIFFPRGDEEPRQTAVERQRPEPEREPPSVAERVVGEFEASQEDDREDRGPDLEEDLPEAGGLMEEEPLSSFDDDADDFDEDGPPRRHNDRGGRGGDRGGRDRGRRGNGRGGPRFRSGRPGAGRPKPLIQDIFKRGQEVLVQVIKEGIGTKGPTLSTYISIAGRYLVLMPGLNRVGVSRKIADEEARRRLREIFHELQPPKGLGFIIRTAGVDRSKKELQRDLAYLSRLWQVVVRRIKKMKSPCEIYQESDMITRTIRDTFTSDIDSILVDDAASYEHAQEFLQIVMPRYASRIRHYAETEPLFHKYGIEDEIARMHRRHVPLSTGGSIVIDQTEALVAIDVNSGNFRADNNAEETAYQMNLQAAKEIARQLRLRDLGGVIVNDFIDMREEKHRRGVERAMRDALKRDRARTKILRMSSFGIIEMTRQRIRPSLKRSVFQECPCCRASGQVKTVESMALDVMRLIQLAAHRENVARVQVAVADEVASYLLNKKRREITRLEEGGELQVVVSGKTSVYPEFLEFLCHDNNGNEVKFMPVVEETRGRPPRREPRGAGERRE